MNHNKHDCAEFQYHPHDKLPILGRPFPLLAITIAHTKSLYHNLCQKNLLKTQSYLNIPIQELKTLLTLTCLPPQITTPQPTQKYPLKPNAQIATTQNAELNQNPEPSHQALTQNITTHPIIKNQNQHQTNSKSPNQKHPLKPNAHIATTQNAEPNQTREPSHQIQNTSPIFACPHPKLGQAFPLTYIQFTHILQPPKPKPNPIRQTPPHPSPANKTNHRHPHRHPHPRISKITNPKILTTTNPRSSQAYVTTFTHLAEPQ